MLRRVKTQVPHPLQRRGAIFLRAVTRRRGLVLRALLCWLIGLFALSNDEIGSYDKRFQLRGDQAARKDILVLNLAPSDFMSMYDVRTNSLSNMAEITDLTDSFFWDKHLWVKFLKKVLDQNPRAVAVSLYFGDNIGSVDLTPDERAILQDPRVSWSTSLNHLERLMTPAFAQTDLSNVGGSDLRRDDDGMVRRIFPFSGEVEHIVEKAAGRRFPAAPNGLFINFRGGSHSFAHVGLSEILNDELPDGFFKNQILIIGADSGAASRYQTPAGALLRSEVMAHLTDNLLENRWIVRFPFAVYAILFGFLTALAVFLITQYPQAVALFFFIWIGTLLAALSAWSFDALAVWTPALSPFIVFLGAWIIFVGYQATRIERMNTRLQQEQRYLQELEQLKNNFVSLISHDLKTPIAKIQAVVGRLKSQDAGGAMTADLKSLQDSSEELNRYIQSILKLLRVESRDFKLHKDVGDINEVIEDALSALRPLAAEKNVRLDANLEPMFSTEFDLTLMKEVVINLVENAIKYTPAGGSVFVSSTEEDDLVRVRVQDTGQGIAPEEIDKVWRKFVRGKDEDMKTKGSGLGLYLVKYFIELHGGQVQLESELGRGSTVSFTLPLTDDTKTEEVTA